MDYFVYSFRQHLFNKHSRKFIKNVLGNIKAFDPIVAEYCLTTLREEFNNKKNLVETIKVERLFVKFDDIVKDLELINTNLNNLKEKVKYFCTENLKKFKNKRQMNFKTQKNLIKHTTALMLIIL